MERLLAIELDASLMAQWERLYDHARKSGHASEQFDEGIPVIPKTTEKLLGERRVLTDLAGVGLFSVGLATGLVWETEWRPWRTEVDDAPLITYLPEVRLVVGQSRIIHGERGDCGKLPREWRDVCGNLPPSRIGDFSDAGIVRRYSMFCKGVTPARGVRFTAKKSGTEEMYVIGDYMKIIVVHEAPLTTVAPEGNRADE